MSRKNLLIGITGSIAAKKTIDLINLLKSNYDIKVICTYEGTNYINKSDYDEIEIYDSWDDDRNNSYHIELSRWADEFIIYPATANILSKISYGIADDVLTSTILMYQKRLKIFPAMHEEMYLNAESQNNLDKITQYHDIYGPRYGKLDAGENGLGRLLEPNEVEEILLSNKKLNIYIVSGPTREYIDDIRFISNASSGKQGRALALESHARGYNTTLISSIIYKSTNNLKQYNFSDTRDLLTTLSKLDMKEGYLFMPAAISDFIPELIKGKMDRRKGTTSINLSPNIDIIKQIKHENPELIVVGFSAQLNTEIDIKKMKEKNVDYLIMNNVSNSDIGFSSDDNEVTIMDKQMNTKHLPFKNKYLIAKEILDYVLP